MSKTPNNKLTVVSSTTPTKPPEPPTITFKHFDNLMIRIDRLVAILDEIVEADAAVSDAVSTATDHPRGKDTDGYAKRRERAIQKIGIAERVLADVRAKWADIEQQVAKCRADFVHYHHRSMFDDDWNLKNPGIIAEKVADMFGSFPNAPQDPKRYIPRMIEEIALTGHFPVIIEGAMRRIVRTSKFPPPVAEMLKALDEETGRWVKRWMVIDTIEEHDEGDALAHWINELPKSIAWAKQEMGVDEKPQEPAPC